MSDGQRHSVADQPSLIDDPIEEAKKEAENAVAQIDRVMDMIDDVVRGGRPFRLRTSMIFDLHRDRVRRPRCVCWELQARRRRDW